MIAYNPTGAALDAPLLASVTFVTTFPFTNPLLVNSPPLNVSTVLYALFVEFAVITSDAGVTVTFTLVLASV